MPTYPSSFIRTTDVYDVDVIQDLDINSTEFKLFLVRLRQSINDLAIVVNQKVGGTLTDQEYVNGKVYPPAANTTKYIAGYQKFMSVGPLANSATTTAYPHGIDFGTTAESQALVRFKSITGAANDTNGGLYKPLPYPSATAANIIEMYADQTNVYIRTNKNESVFDTVDITLEYTKG